MVETDEPNRGDGDAAGAADVGAAEAGPGAGGSPAGVAGSGGDPEAGGGETGTALPPKVEAWRRRSAAGAILTGFALGLQEVLETHRDEPSIVVQTSGDPPDDLPVEAEFEYGRPRQSVVSIRPWLLNESRRDGQDRPGGDS